MEAAWGARGLGGDLLPLILNNLLVTQQPHSEVFTQEKWKLTFIKNLYVNNYSSLFHQKSETTHMSFMDK